jgi:hypothetical protein
VEKAILSVPISEIISIKDMRLCTRCQYVDLEQIAFRYAEIAQNIEIIAAVI